MGAVKTSIRFILVVLVFIFIFSNSAFAIPSPELIIGSVSSAGQVFAVVFAVISGGMTTIAARLGFKANKKQNSKKMGVWASVCFCAAIGLLALNYIQYNQAQNKEAARLQATLVRPAQFAGTKIQDSSLIETSFDAQNINQFAISSQAADELLQSSKSNPDILFLDIRERAEREMGGLVDSNHVRFPDIQQNAQSYAEKKVVLYCHNGNRSSETCANLAAMGIDCSFIAGGIEKWIVEGREFSDEQVRGLSDLRAIPEYPNKSTLLGTDAFKAAVETQDIQIIDTRYPGDFATGHLPNAINIPLRALPTDQLNVQIKALEEKPTVVACYDRRSCFMGQVLGWELANRGIDFMGRYTTPWEYFVAPKPKPHVLEWQAAQSMTNWQRMIDALAGVLIWAAERSHIILAIAALSLLSRLLVLPISIKSERDQIISNQNASELKEMKKNLVNDPVRRARALKQFYADNGMTPLRNLTALLFLPVMMLGLSAVEKAAQNASAGFLWLSSLGELDPTYLLPAIFSILAGVYFQFAVAKTFRGRMISWVLAVPALFGLTFQLSAAGNIYLCFSLLFLLIQRAYVIDLFGRLKRKTISAFRLWKVRNLYHGVAPLHFIEALNTAGNKSLRLSILKNAGLPVPSGAVICSDALHKYSNLTSENKDKFSKRIWNMVDQKNCAVRSSAADEDGEDKSYAGVFDSVLNVNDKTMQSALDAVINSFKSERSAQYEGVELTNHQGNILIQEMVNAKYSGVLFTQDPNAPGLVLIEMAHGTADDLVSGRVTPITVQFGRFTGRQIGDQELPIDLSELVELGKKVEQIFDAPQDIEWAFGDTGFEIVQSRDITTLNTGSAAELARRKEWQGLFETLGKNCIDGVVLEQDEMSEVLPRPTPLSFSVMGDVWAPGGSVDTAARSLNLSYNMPEGKPGYLIRLFGKLYSDVRLKQQTAFTMTKQDAKRLDQHVQTVETEFYEVFLPKIDAAVGLYEAINFETLPKVQLIDMISTIHRQFVDDFYVMAEKINILAGYTTDRAQQFCIKQRVNSSALFQSHLPHAPSQYLTRHSELNKVDRMAYLIKEMGHRSVFDYELSSPRYSETPKILWQMAQVSLSHEQSNVLSTPKAEPVELALKYQDLKEYAKHQSLRLFSQMRRAIQAFDDQNDLGGLVFYLTIEEVFGCNSGMEKGLKNIALERREFERETKKHAPKETFLSLEQCEQMSGPNAQLIKRNSGQLSGTRVSGEGMVSGKCYVVDTEFELSGDALIGFEPGDILVCQMVHPAWMPHVIEASAVLSQVGGWLSHMAIVAREKGVTMFVACEGLESIEHGAVLDISHDGDLKLGQKHIPKDIQIVAE